MRKAKRRPTTSATPPTGRGPNFCAMRRSPIRKICPVSAAPCGRSTSERSRRYSPACPPRSSREDPTPGRDCQEEARRLRTRGATGFAAPSAALLPGAARGWRVDGGLQPGPGRDGKVIVLFGSRPDLVGWVATLAGGPGEDLLCRVRHFPTSDAAMWRCVT